MCWRKAGDASGYRIRAVMSGGVQLVQLVQLRLRRRHPVLGWALVQSVGEAPYQHANLN